MINKVLLIGASTGGPTQIKEILSQITNLSFNIIVVQHMREEVLPFFIKDLKDSLKVKVQSTPHVLSFSQPSIIVCSGSCVLSKKYATYEIVNKKDGQHYTPDIDMLLNSFSNYASDFNIKVLIMTGIGRDGVNGSINLKAKGATIMAQDESSSPVFGMPKAAYDSGIVDEVKSLDEIKNYFRGL